MDEDDLDDLWRDEAETGLSRRNSWRTTTKTIMMMMMMMMYSNTISFVSGESECLQKWTSCLMMSVDKKIYQRIRLAQSPQASKCKISSFDTDRLRWLAPQGTCFVVASPFAVGCNCTILGLHEFLVLSYLLLCSSFISAHWFIGRFERNASVGVCCVYRGLRA